MSAAPIALIPLRAGSKGLPGKNTRSLVGRPLYAHTLEHARLVGIEEVVVTTDIGFLLGADLGSGIRVAERPAALAQDTTPIEEVLRHVLAVDIKGPATIVLLQATSPLRAPNDIGRAIDLHAAGEFDLVLSATRAQSGVLKWGSADGARFVPIAEPAFCFANRASLPPLFRPDGAIYVFDADWFRGHGQLATDRIGMIETSNECALDIDTLADFDAAEARLKGDA